MKVEKQSKLTSAGGERAFKGGNFRMVARQGKAPIESITLSVDFKIRNSNICLA